MKKVIRSWMFLVGVVVGLAGCGMPGVQQMPGMHPAAGGESATGSTPTTGELVVAREFAYDPAALEARVGVPLTIRLQNDGTLEHDWSVRALPADAISSEGTGGMNHMMHGGDSAALALHVAAAVGTSSTITFTPTETGSYEYFCSVPGHLEAGMVGTLTVAP